MSEANKLSQDDLKTERYLPHSRIRTIMKSSADPSALNIKEEALQIVSRATELFIQLLAQESQKCCEKSKTNKTLDYKHLADYVQSEDRLEFLHQIVPKKITVKQFRDIMAKQKSHENFSDSSTPSTSSGEEEDDDDENNEEEEDDEKDEDDDDDDVKTAVDEEVADEEVEDEDTADEETADEETAEEEEDEDDDCVVISGDDEEVDDIKTTAKQTNNMKDDQIVSKSKPKKK